MEGDHRGGETQEERARRMEKAVEVIEAPGEQEVPLAEPLRPGTRQSCGNARTRPLSP